MDVRFQHNRTVKVLVSLSCTCISVVLEATHEASPEPLKDTVSAQKALQGSKSEMKELLGGTEDNSVSPMRGH